MIRWARLYESRSLNTSTHSASFRTRIIGPVLLTSTTLPKTIG